MYAQSSKKGPRSVFSFKNASRNNKKKYNRIISFLNNSSVRFFSIIKDKDNADANTQTFYKNSQKEKSFNATIVSKKDDFISSKTKRYKPSNYSATFDKNDNQVYTNRNKRNVSLESKSNSNVIKKDLNSKTKDQNTHPNNYAFKYNTNKSKNNSKNFSGLSGNDTFKKNPYNDGKGRFPLRNNLGSGSAFVPRNLATFSKQVKEIRVHYAAAGVGAKFLKAYNIFRQPSIAKVIGTKPHTFVNKFKQKTRRYQPRYKFTRGILPDLSGGSYRR